MVSGSREEGQPLVRADEGGVAGPEEAESMAEYSALLANASHALVALNVRHSSAVKIGAVVLDSEKYEYCDHHNDSATGKAYDSCAESVWKALTRKNNLVYSASKAAFPDAFVMQYLLRHPSNPRCKFRGLIAGLKSNVLALLGSGTIAVA